MVDLVLHRGGPEPDKIAFFNCARLIQKPHRHRTWPADRHRSPRQVGAGLIINPHLNRGMQYFGIGHSDGLAARFRTIHHRKPLHHPDLHRRQTDTRHRIHGLNHIVPDHPGLIRHRRNRRHHGFQPRVGKGHKSTHTHGRAISRLSFCILRVIICRFIAPR